MDISYFALNVFKLIESSQDPKKLNQFLSTNQSELNDDLLQKLPNTISTLLSNAPSEHKVSVAYIACLFAGLIQQFPTGNRALNLELAIVAYESALPAINREERPAEWAGFMSGLAGAYAMRPFGNRAENMEKAIETLERSLQVLTPEAHLPIWGEAISNLASAYTDRILGDRAKNIEQAIEMFKQLTQTMTREVNPAVWSMAMMNLATSHILRIRGEKAQSIEDAITYYKQSLTVRTPETMPFDWADSMTGLATAYRERIVGDRAKNIERAIDIHKQALRVRTREDMPLEWAVSMSELASAYLDRIEGEPAENVEMAIEAYSQALEVITAKNLPVQWAAGTLNLANAYVARIKGDRAQNLEQALTACKQSLQIRTREVLAVEWAQSLLILGSIYSQRILGDRKHNQEQAIDALLQAKEVITEDSRPAEWAKLMGNLANAYFVLTSPELVRDEVSRAQNIETSLEISLQATRVMTKAARPLLWSQLMVNIGNNYQSRVEGERRDNIEQAIAFYEQSLEVRTRSALPVEWAQSLTELASAYAKRIEGDRQQNMATAISYYRQVLEVHLPDRLPNECRRTARLLGNLCCDLQRWTEAVEAYQKGLEATETLYQSSLLRSSQEAELAETSDLFRRAAYAQAKAGDLRSAVIILEQGRARGLSDTLEQDRTDLSNLEAIAPQAYRQYQQAVLALRQLERTERTSSHTVEAAPSGPRPSELRQQAESVRGRFNAAISTIREQSGYERFLMTADWEDIVTAAKPNQPLVYLLPTPNGSLALIVRKCEKNIQLVPIWLDALTADLQNQLLNGNNRDWSGWFGGYSAQQSNLDEWKDTLDRVTHQLWQVIMEPIVSYLTSEQINSAVLIPTGYLSFLPLHAAWTADSHAQVGRRYALDTLAFTYAPNARSLNIARTIASRTLADALLAVGEPQPTSAQPLRYASREMDAITTCFPRHITLTREQAKREAVLLALPHSNILHFSCHGISSFNTPLSSGLLLADSQRLTLRDILDVRVEGIRLAVLSACETGVLGTKLPDEVVSLSAGLLQAGVAGIAASLWSVADMSTMLLVRRFYEYWQEEGFTLPEALRLAQCWLRDTTSQQKAKHFKATDSALYRELILYPSEHFAHPHHWAAFTYTGA